MSQTKRCGTCHRNLDLDNFHKNKDRKDGFGSRCKGCSKIESRKLREKYKQQNAIGIDKSGSKTCSKCNQEVPRTKYYEQINAKDGLQSACMECSKQRVREWRVNNLDVANRWYRENREYARGLHREWLKENTEHITRYKKKYRDEHQEEIREYRKQYWRENTDAIRKRREENREQYTATRKRWEANNPELVRAKGHRYRTKKAGNGGSYTPMEWFDLCETYNWQCLCCGKHSYESPLTVDHIIPVTKGGSSNISDLQPLCDHCNKAKSTKTTDYRLEQNMHPAVLSHLQTTRSLRDSITVLLQSILQDI